MKSYRIILILLTLFLVNQIMDASVKIENLYYDLRNGQATVTYSPSNYNNYSGLTEVTIPEFVDYENERYVVTKIGDDAFLGARDLKHISLPNSLKTIGEWAFASSNIISLWIPNSVETIGKDFIYGCGNLVTVIIGSGVKSLGINSNSSYNKYPQKTIWLGNKPPQYAEYWHSEYNYVSSEAYDHVFRQGTYLPNTLIKYENLASYFVKNGIFYVPVDISERTCDIIDCTYEPNCTSIEIGSNIMYNNISLKIKSIQPFSFYENCFIESIDFSGGNFDIKEYSFYNCTNLKNINIPSTVQNIENYAFYGCTSNESLILKNNGEIGSYAFYNNSNAKILDVSNAGNILDYAFSKNSSLNELYINNEGYIASNAFEESATDGNGKLIIGPKTTSIGNKAFYGCSSIKDAHIKNNGEIREAAFQNCGFEILKVENCSNIGNEAFKNCDSLRTASFNNVIGYLGDNTFAGCYKLETIHLGDKITQIGAYCFSGCQALTSIEIPESVTKIGEYAFRACGSLEEVSLPSSLTSLPNALFASCRSLKKINIPGSIKLIGMDVFNGCTSLKGVIFEEAKNDSKNEKFDVSFPDFEWTQSIPSEYKYTNLYVIGHAGDKLSFDYGIKGTGAGYIWLKDESGSSFSISQNKEDKIEHTFKRTGVSTIEIRFRYYAQIGGPNEATFYISNIKVTGNNWNNNLLMGNNGEKSLFYDCPLDSLFLGRKLDYSLSPFYGNKNLKVINISDEIDEISNNEFAVCLGIEKVSIGNKVKQIGSGSFSGCSNLKFISMGRNVQKIGNEAFSDCGILEELYCYNPIPPECGNQALSDINKWTCKLLIPKNSTDLYTNSPQWKDFFYIEEMEEILVQNILLNHTVLNLSINESQTLSSTIIPLNATFQDVFWISKDESIATVSENGIVTGINMGSTQIIATCGDVSATCEVSVKDAAGIEEVKFEDERVNVYSIDGVLIKKQFPFNELNQLESGIYIIKSKIGTFKLKK